MSEAAAREWRFYVDDMIAFGEKVRAFTSGLDQQAFVANALVYDATLRNLELIGEAATHVPGHVRVAHPEVPWRMIIATRKRLIHAYLGIDTTRCGASLSARCRRCWWRCARCGRRHPDSARVRSRQVRSTPCSVAGGTGSPCRRSTRPPMRLLQYKNLIVTRANTGCSRRCSRG